MPSPARSAQRLWQALLRWLLLAGLTGLLLQTVFALQIASLRWLGEPPSTAFQRSAIWQLLRSGGGGRWQHQPIGYAAMPNHIKRAVVASEDSLFFEHQGVDWQAIQSAWRRNARNAEGGGRILGGSTITQQLAKNLFLSGERAMPRKAQELLLTWMLELALPKERILEIYLNQAEWGLGIYGIEAASRHYYGHSARQLSQEQAARLAVLLPQPRRLGQNLYSAYVQGRTRAISGRMQAIELPASRQTAKAAP